VQVCQLHNVSDVSQVVEQIRPKVALAGSGSLQVHPVLVVVTTCRLLNKFHQILGGKIFKLLSDDDGTIELSNPGPSTFGLPRGINIFPNR
jgi:hypothetical protein